jgi:hypothetical protein
VNRSFKGVGAGGPSQIGRFADAIVKTASYTPPTYTIGGTVSGLSSGTLVLTDGIENVSITMNGGFTFPTAQPPGTAYTVSVVSEPGGDTTVIANASGTVGYANVTNVGVAVTTAPLYSISGTATGNATGAQLTDGFDTITLSGAGAFTFPTGLPRGTVYAVSVVTEPAYTTSIISNGSGTVTGNVTNVGAAFTLQTYAIGGTMTGLPAGLSMQLTDGIDTITVNTNGVFVFPTAEPTGTAYAVTALTVPNGFYVILTNSVGTVASANVTNIGVTVNQQAGVVSLYGQPIESEGGVDLTTESGVTLYTEGIVPSAATLTTLAYPTFDSVAITFDTVQYTFDGACFNNGGASDIPAQPNKAPSVTISSPLFVPIYGATLGTNTPYPVTSPPMTYWVNGVAVQSGMTP